MVKINTAHNVEEAIQVIRGMNDTVLDVHRFSPALAAHASDLLYIFCSESASISPNPRLPCFVNFLCLSLSLLLSVSVRLPVRSLPPTLLFNIFHTWVAVINIS